VRDYVTLAAAAVNRNGKVSYVLIAYFWSTVDRAAPGTTALPEPLVPAGDDRRIELALRGHSAHEAGSANPCSRPRHRSDTECVRDRSRHAALRDRRRASSPSSPTVRDISQLRLWEDHAWRCAASCIT